jgi:hypothetical protein
MYLIHRESGKQLSVGDLLILDKEWLSKLGKKIKGVQTQHAEIVKEGDRCYIRGKAGKTLCNGYEIKEGEEADLDHGAVLHIGDPRKGTILVFKNLDQSRRLADTQKLMMVKNLDNLKSAAELLGKEFFGSVPTDLKKFSQYLLTFLVKKFGVHRAVLFEVRDGKWYSLEAKAVSAQFQAPMRILRQVMKERLPVRFDRREAQEAGDESKSIINDNVLSAICFPLIRDGKFVGVIYMDIQKGQQILSQNDLIVLFTLMPPIASYLYLLLCQEKQRCEVAEVLSSFCKTADVSDLGLECEFKNHKLSSFAFARRGKDDSVFFFFVRIANKRKDETDFTMQIAAYSGIFSLLDTFQVYGECLKQILTSLHDYLTGRYPTLSVGIGVVRMIHRHIDFTGIGDTRLVVKLPERNSFVACSADSFYEKEDTMESYAIDCDLTPGSYFVLSGVGEKLCTLMDRITNLARVREELRSLPGFVYCYTGEE